MFYWCTTRSAAAADTRQFHTLGDANRRSLASPGVEMTQLVAAFAHGMKVADGTSPRFKQFAPGIGPHSEPATVRLALAHSGHSALERARVEVPYPDAPRLLCDVGTDAWAIEVKMLRMKRNNGDIEKYSPVAKILSPYPADRSALTDVQKLTASAFTGRKGILLFGYDYEHWPMDPVVEAFEVLASRLASLTRATPSMVTDLVHPHHRTGRVFGWEIRLPSDN
jgi:hypothetical protein